MTIYSLDVLLFLIWNQSVVTCLVLAVASWPAYRFLKRQVRWSGIPISFRILTVYCDPHSQHLLELRKRCPFHRRGLECKSTKSRDTQNNKQLLPWTTNEAVKRTRELCQENTLVTMNSLFQQTKRWLYTWYHHVCPCVESIPNGTLHMDFDFGWSISKSDWLCSLQAQDGKALFSLQK